MPKVGVKFCGGCNPAIDRGSVFQEIRDRADGLVFTGLDAQDLDAFLFVCGCSTACPVVQLGFRGRPGLIVVAGESVDDGPVAERDIASAVAAILRMKFAG